MIESRLASNLVIVESVQASLERSNFNDPGEVANALERIGLPSSILGPFKEALGTLMARRHWIVHRIDRAAPAELGPHATQSLEQTTVDRWLEAVRQLSAAVLREI